MFGMGAINASGGSVHFSKYAHKEGAATPISACFSFASQAFERTPGNVA